MNHADLLKRLLPVGAYDPGAPVIAAELGAEGNALDAAQVAADLILTESDPRATLNLLPDWERELGLPDPGAVQPPTVEQRRAAVVAKVIMRGGQSRSYFVALADELGFPDASITEFKPMTCNDTCNDALYGEADRFAWQINLPSSSLPLWGSAQVEFAIRKFSPAHTSPVFAYF